MVAVKLREVKNLSKLPPPPTPQSVFIYLAQNWQSFDGLTSGRASASLPTGMRTYFLETLGTQYWRKTYERIKFRGVRVLPIMSYTGRLRPKGIPFFRLQVYKRVGISLVVVCKRIRKSVISSVKRPKRANRCILWLGKSREKYSGLVINSCLKESAFTALKWVQYSKPGN